MKAEIGDWVRFYFAGRLVIAEVVYIEHNEYRSEQDEYLTDAGAVSRKAVLEVRKKP